MGDRDTLAALIAGWKEACYRDNKPHDLPEWLIARGVTVAEPAERPPEETP